MNNCPCGLDKTYEDCCGKFHNFESIPTTAEQLMRSRYSAYAKIDTEYLLKTSHPSTRKNYVIEDIKSWAEENIWQKLQIIKIQKGQKNQSEGIVEFKAFYLDKEGNTQKHHEKSSFVKEGNTWFYLKGKVY